MPGVNSTQEDVFTTTISDILTNATVALSNQTDGPGGGHELSPVKAKVKQIFDILIIILICVIMMSVGAVVKLDMLKAHFRRPVGLIIGMVCQFIILPGVTFGLAHALQFERWNAIGMILIGTTPGGSLSNMYTYYIDGDVPLSVSMTATSTVVGIGMMPLNAWIYSRSWADHKTVIPYVNIIVGLASMLIPVAIGMVILAKLPKVAAWVIRIGSVLGVVLLIGIVTMFSYVYPEVFEAKWNMWVGSVIVVIIPVTISFIAASIFCLPIASRKAILIETGVQNTGLCLALIAVSYDESLYVEIITFPILYSLFNVSLFLLLTLLYRVVMLLRKDGGVDEEKKPSNDKDEVKPTTNDEKFDKSTFGKSDAGDLELTRL